MGRVAFPHFLQAGSQRRRALRGLLLCTLMLPLESLAAQALPPQVQPPTREEVERPTAPPGRVADPELIVDREAERAPCALARPEYTDIRFTLREASFDNLQGLAPADLRSAWQPFVGSEHPVSIICDIRDRASAILDAAGYVAAVEVPEQDITAGRVRFNVLMAKLVGLRIRGDAGRNERLVTRTLEPLTRRPVFNRYDAERHLLLAGEIPGQRVRLALRTAGGAPGEVIGEVTIQRSPGSADLTVQNYGSDEVGPWGALLRGQLYGITGLGDRTTLALFASPDFEEQRTVQIGHDFRLGGDGLAIGGQATWSWARPDLGDPAIDFRSRTFFATLEASYPFVRRQARTLRGSIGLDFIDQYVDFNGLDFTRDKLRVAFARLSYDLFPDRRDAGGAWEPGWHLAFTLEGRQGLDILGASEGCGAALAGCTGPGVIPPTRLEGDPTASVIRGSAFGEFRLTPALSMVAGTRAQYSGSALYAFEEYAAGNYTIGRGYDPGALLGDRGIGVQAELRYGGLAPRNAGDVALQGFVFADQVWIDNEDVAFVLPDDEVTSLGLGLRAAWGNRVRLEAMLAFPLDRTSLDPDRDPRFLITFTTALWPWSY